MGSELFRFLRVAYFLESSAKYGNRRGLSWRLRIDKIAVLVFFALEAALNRYVAAEEQTAKQGVIQ